MKKKHFFTLILMTFLMNLYGQNIFQRHFGSAGNDFVRNISPTNDKGFIVIGYTTHSSNGLKDIFISKFSNADNLEWTKTYGGNGDDDGFTIVQTTDGGYIFTGTSNSYGTGDDDVIVIKTDQKGIVEWNKIYSGNGHDLGRDIYELPDNSYLLLSETTSNSFGLMDICLTMIDKSGKVIWSKLYGGTQNELCYNFRRTNDGNFLLAGITYSYGFGKHDMFLLKVKPDGTLLKCMVYGQSGDDYAYSAVQDENGDIGIGGFSITGNTGKDNTFIKTDSNFKIIWQKSFGGIKDEYIVNVMPTAQGEVFIPGMTYSYGHGDRDVFLAKFSKYGQLSFFKTYGGLNDDNVANRSSIFADYDNIIIAAVTTSFKQVQPFRSNNMDGYLIKTDYYGNSGCYEDSFKITLNNVNLQAKDIMQNIGIKSNSWNVFSKGSGDSVDFSLNSICFTGIKEELTNNISFTLLNSSDNSIILRPGRELFEALEIKFFDLQGKMLLSIKFPSGLNQEIPVTFDSLPTGIYIYQIISGSNVLAGKFIIN